MEAALFHAGGRCILNSANLEDGEAPGSRLDRVLADVRRRPGVLGRRARQPELGALDRVAAELRVLHEDEVPAVATDAAGHTTRTDLSFYALGNGYTAWERYDHNRIDLTPEHKTWKPGENARIMIKSPWESATALLTVEREGIRSVKRFTLTSTQQTVEFRDGLTWARGAHLFKAGAEYQHTGIDMFRYSAPGVRAEAVTYASQFGLRVPAKRVARRLGVVVHKENIGQTGAL